MFARFALNAAVAGILWVALLGALRFQPWQATAGKTKRELLTVGFLPVT